MILLTVIRLFATLVGYFVIAMWLAGIFGFASFTLLFRAAW